MNISYTPYNVDLPNPIFGDSIKFSSQGIKRIMPQGQLKVFKDPDWPVLETFTYDIHKLTKAQKDDFIQLINACVGNEVTITDHNGAIRTGFIITPVNEILTLQDSCWYDIHFEYMATAIVTPIGDCHDDISIDIPYPGDSDYIRTIGDESYYRIYDEDDAKMYAENDDDLWIEEY